MRPLPRAAWMLRVFLALVAAVLAAGSSRPVAAAARVSTTFFDGRLSGGGHDDWNLWIAVRGRSAYAVLSNLPDDGDRPVAFRAAGSFRNGQVNLRIATVPVDGDEPPTVLGNLTGKLRNGRINGSFVLERKRGTFATTRVARRTGEPNVETGEYETADDGLVSAVIFKRDGTFQVKGRLLRLTVTLASGVWMEDKQHNLWLLPLDVNDPLFGVNFKAKMPIKLGTDLDDEEGDLILYKPFEPDVEMVFLILT